MKQFKTIFAFEYGSYGKNKVFVGLTAVLLIVMAVVLFFPRFSSSTGIGVPDITKAPSKNIAVCDKSGVYSDMTFEYLKNGLENDKLTAVNCSEEELKLKVQTGEFNSAILLLSPVKYKYIVENSGITDMTTMKVDGILASNQRVMELSKLGINENDINSIMSIGVESELVITGKDQSQSFFYTYILMFLLYIAVLMYGQFVAQSVAVEKSSRAMELLITSAKPINLMFGKVLGAGAAGFTQLVLLLGGAYTFYSLNKSYWADNIVVKSIFGMPLSMLLYTILFFVLGYFLYSFMYGALASLASRLEDINTLTMPITFMMITSFMITIFSMINNVDSPIMKVASFIPFTSPMAMFTRIAMGNVTAIEIIISVVILIVTTIGIGYLAAAIYKIGVLMYGKPPKMNEVMRALRNNRANKS
ncbi:MAG: ABC transporter permease [Oscillospiraceae bacterium]